MMVAGSLDTNVLARLVLNDVPALYLVARRLIAGSRGHFAVSDTAYVELAFALERHYHLSRPQIAEAIRGLLALPMLDSNRVLVEQAIGPFIAHRTLSFEDCYLAASAELHGATPLWTFDKKLATKLATAQLVPKV